MALMSETPSPPNGVVDIINSQSGGANDEDLEDGEIFDDDDDDAGPPAPSVADAPHVEQQHPIQQGPPVMGKRRGSPHLDRLKGIRRRRPGKRQREEGRMFIQRDPKNPNKRRKSDDEKQPKERDYESEDMEPRGDSPNHRAAEWDRFRSDEEEENAGFGGEGRRGRGGRRDFNRPNRRKLRVGNRRSRRDVPSVCKFYLQGKCQRGSECPFSHDMPCSNRKFELCKFYMNDCCNKRDKCQFMHSDYPCKYHHLGLKCYSGRRCKFSHCKVTPYVKQMLVKHNQLDGDRQFLQHLPTLSPLRDSRSPSPPPHDFNDYDYQQHSANDYSFSGPRRRHHNDFQGDGEEFGGPTGSRGGGRGGRQRQMKSQDDRLPYEDQDHRHYHEDQDMRESEGEDGPRTPMPSPSQDNCSDGDGDEGELEIALDPIPPNESPKPESQSPEPKENEEFDDSNDVANLPKKQRELYLRIQQQQREAENLEDGGGKAVKDEDYKEENWYSSDDEGNNGPLAMLLTKLKKPAEANPDPQSGTMPDFDVSAVSKLLSSVRETIEQQKGTHEVSQSESTQSKIEEKRRRDPRLMRSTTPPKSLPTPLSSSSDVDLRLSRPPPGSGDVDLRQLPFKPAPPHMAANEINASLAANPMAHLYQLQPLSPPPKPDYSYLNFKNPIDPRLKKFVGSGGVGIAPMIGGPVMGGPVIGGPVMGGQPMLPPPMGPPMLNFPPGGPIPPPHFGGPVPMPHPGPGPSGLPARDPRQRALANDPRRKQVPPPGPPLQQPNPYMFPSGPPHLRGDSDLRNGPPFQHLGDVDLRFHQPVPPHFPFK